MKAMSISARRILTRGSMPRSACPGAHCRSSLRHHYPQRQELGLCLPRAGVETNAALETNYGQYMGVLVQAPDVPDIWLKVRYKFGLPPKALPPAAPEAPPVAIPQTVPVRSYLVFFDWDRADLTDRARQIVAAAATASTHVQTTRIKVNGYTDLSGTVAYNQKLSIRRAQTVEAELVHDGVAKSEIDIHGYGESDPLVPTAKGVREPQNRRVEVILK